MTADPIADYFARGGRVTVLPTAVADGGLVHGLRLPAEAIAALAAYRAAHEETTVREAIQRLYRRRPTRSG